MKKKIQDAAGVRKTRSGNVLIEINGQTTASDVTEKLNSAIRQEVEIVPLLNRSTLELKKHRSPYY
jgi:predicted deacylase